MKLPRVFDDATYAAMRAVLAFLFCAHGLQKVFGIWGGHAFPLTSQLGIAGLLETLLGPLIGLGLFTSPAAFVASGEMAFAFYIGHYPKGLLPAINGGDLAAALCFAFLYISVRGGGAWSLDALVRGKR
jgi:putative oxidoreductase